MGTPRTLPAAVRGISPRAWVAGIACVASSLSAIPSPAAEARAQSTKVTVLSTMLADAAGIGEWGFAALVEVDGQRLLFDTGAREETVLRNAQELNLDLSGITDVVLSHNHGDHTGGLLTLRRSLSTKNASALSRAHVAPGIFLPRRSETSPQAERNPMPGVREAYEKMDGRIVEHSKPEQIAPRVWLTGPVPRRHPERNFGRRILLLRPEGSVEDSLPEDQSLVIDGDDGLVVVTGCGHAGIGNILAHAREIVPGRPVQAVVGGLHLLEADEPALAWTAERMREAGLKHLIGAHCTGLEAVYRLRALLGLDRRSAVVGAVGSSFASATGIDARLLAR
jgi:7,8-dihydropterin-6-yl-methyl-4-(beta-D-ribofuranosyl)aminobenzene 5'-phosphate synthase